MCSKVPVRRTVVSLETFIKEIDQALGLRWSQDREDQSYTEEEARVAAVLTRMDMGLSASILGYNAKMLTSIRNGIWIIVVIEAIDLLRAYI
jgi:hypothetical protein